MGQSASVIILEYVCPALGVVTGNIMFSSPVRDCYAAVLAGRGLQSLNPTPWVFMLGNTFGWVTYAILTNNLFVFFANSPGFLVSVWLNLQAVKMQYESFRSNEMRKSIVSALEQADTSSCHLQDEETRRLSPVEESPSLRDSLCQNGDADSSAVVTPTKETTSNSFGDATRVVWDVTAQKMAAPAPHEAMVMGCVFIWLVITSLVALVSSFSYRTNELIVGITVNINLVFFYGAPLSTIFTVLRTKNVATINIPTLSTNFFNGVFWAAYGSAVRDLFIAIPNAVGALLGAIQIVLCFIFPRKTDDTSSKQDAPATGSTANPVPDTSTCTTTAAKVTTTDEESRLVVEHVTEGNSTSSAEP